MIRKSTVLAIGLVAIYALASGSIVNAAAEKPPKPPKPPEVHTKEGRVIGMTVGGVNEFLGIPYAAPPVGALRWRPPRVHGAFGSPFTADKFGSACTQPTNSGGIYGAEDCLFLNVYSPASATSSSGLPVMIYIHGGALIKGDSEDFDPTPLVGQGVVVVTINYRLGYLGFFAQKNLDKEKHLLGNYGTMDQQFAMQWVQKNIGGFGGDPAQVTIWGESAGGESVYINVASLPAASLFRAAIAESGAYVFQSYLDPIISLTAGETTGTGVVPSGIAIANSVGCTDQKVACLRAVSAANLVAIEPNVVHPFIDGSLLAGTPAEVFASGKFNQVPMIAGTNHDEYRYFVAERYDLNPGVGPLTDPEYPTAVATLLQQPVMSTAVQSLINTEYPLSNYPPPAGVMSAPLALGALGTDFMFACPQRAANLLQVGQPVPVPVYVYEFNDENAPSVFPPSEPLSFPPGDCHTVELQYLFSTTPALPTTEQPLSDAMVTYWTQFAKTMNPNSSGAPTWPEYGAGGSIESMVLPGPVTEADASFDADHQCSSYWDSF